MMQRRKALAVLGGTAGAWLLPAFAAPREQVRRIARRVTRVAVVPDAMFPSGIGQFGAIQATASSFGVELTPVGVRDAAEIEQGVRAFVRGPNDAMIVTASPLSAVHREVITA